MGVYLVLGVANTGSCSLTWPEDFDLLGYFDNEADAEKYAEAKNKEEGVPKDPDEEDFEDDLEYSEALEEFHDYEGMVYEVYELDKLVA
jgi:hypothetical protein